ncbi:MAG: hypothetical protein [Bacteriophage sp.]|nr:MAG: hypothetical protein [Bacteriophage sp.]
MIQKAHKKAYNNFNDVVAQLYQQEFKTQEKAKYEHIKQAKEKAIEEQQKLEEDKARTEQLARDDRERAEQGTKEINGLDNNNTAIKIDEAVTTTENSTSSVIGNDWSQVSPEIAANYMASKTGVSASKWLDVIYKESSGNPYALNSLSCYGLLQIMQSVHGQVSQLSPQAYLDKAVSIYQGSGGTAWATW